MDIIVVGAGPAGASTAIASAELGHRVLMIDRATFPRPRIGESLPPKVVPLLAILGARSEVEGAGFVRMRGTTVCSGSELQTHLFDPDEGQLGFQVDRAIFDHLLVARARSVGVRVIEEASMVAVLRDGATPIGVSVEHAGRTHETRAEFVVDASGRGATVARALGLRHRDSIRTAAVCGYWTGTSAPSGFAAEDTFFEMLEDGWIWSVLLADGRRNVTFGGEPARFGGSKEARAQSYFQSVRASAFIGPMLHDAELDGELQIHDATWSAAEHYAGQGFLLVGDAASFIDPLTSQGVYKALQSGIVAASVINTALRRPSDRPLALEFYERTQAEFERNYASIALSLYRASPLTRSPFWQLRTREAEPLEPAFEVDPVRAEAKRAELVAALEKLGGDSIRIAKSTHVALVDRGVARGGWIERASVWLDLRSNSVISTEIDAPTFDALLDGRSVASLFEEYARRTESPASAQLGKRLMTALCRLLERDLVEWSVDQAE